MASPALPHPNYYLLPIVTILGKIDVNYVPDWVRGNPNNYIDRVRFSRPLTDKDYKYRVTINGQDLGARAWKAQSDGSVDINLLNYNGGRGIDDTTSIRVYLIEPQSEHQYVIARWK